MSLKISEEPCTWHLALNINPDIEEPITFSYIPRPRVSSAATESSRSSTCTASSTLPGEKNNYGENTNWH